MGRKHGCAAHNSTFPCPVCHEGLFCTDCWWLLDEGCGVGIKCDWFELCQCTKSGGAGGGVGGCGGESKE